MTVTYFKRYRMEVRLDQLRADVLAEASAGRNVEHRELGVELIPWSPRILGSHAEVKWASFREEIDAHVFPCLSNLNGCRQLMREISSRHDFVPEATWLAVRRSEFGDDSHSQLCGTIQGLRPASQEGAIQNLGVHPDCREMGVGGLLLEQALRGFQSVGCRYVHLEVTVQNASAIRLYERFGFERVETLFKISEVQYA